MARMEPRPLSLMPSPSRSKAYVWLLLLVVGSMIFLTTAWSTALGGVKSLK